MPTRVPASEFDARLETVRSHISEDGVDAGVWFGATSIEYLCGFDHIQTERPVCLAVTQDRLEITVPRLEVERVEQNPRIDAVHHYFDYPQGEPMTVVADMLDGLDVESVAADADGAPGVMGYEGPNLSDSVDVDTQAWVAEMRYAKSEVEVDLVRESARWGNLAHRYLYDSTDVGRHPAEVSMEASTKASRAMLDTLGDEYVPRSRGSGPVFAGYITGEQTRLPHGHTANRRLKEGDVAITGAAANIDGYHSELERTLFLGWPDEDQRHYFELMKEAQTIAIEALAPGVPLADVDEEVTAYFEEHGVADLAQHHVGHNIGLGGHEPPYIDAGWDGEMQVGEIYTIEPGLYTDRYGYRHSDTVAVTEDGYEMLTYFPRDLEGNVIEV